MHRSGAVVSKKVLLLAKRCCCYKSGAVATEVVLLLRDRHLDTPSNIFAGGITDTSSRDRARQLMTLTLTPTGYAVNMSSWAIIRATVTRLSSADVMTIPMARRRALLDKLHAHSLKIMRETMMR